LGLGLLLLGQRKGEVSRPPDLVEVRVEILESPAVASWPHAKSSTAALHDGSKLAARETSNGQSPARRQIRKDAPGAEGVADSVALAPTETMAESSPQEGSGNVERLWTLRPLHPDLSRAGRFLAPETRDLLAAPAMKPKQAAPSELPETLEGGAGVTARVADDGAIHFADANNLGFDVSKLSGRFDLTDMVMRHIGQDPYAAIKRNMADETREQRICMARQAQARRLVEALAQIGAKVRGIARRSDLSPLERRRAVFEIWDECAEGSTDLTADYGEKARSIIQSAIRELFPAGTDLGYSPAELLVLNERRTSRRRFAPYEREDIKPPPAPDALP
jgi:hypothetical protein